MVLATAFPVAARGSHAVVDAVPPGVAAAVREQDAKNPGLDWQRFGVAG